MSNLVFIRDWNEVTNNESSIRLLAILGWRVLRFRLLGVHILSIGFCKISRIANFRTRIVRISRIAESGMIVQNKQY